MKNNKRNIIAQESCYSGIIVAVLFLLATSSDVRAQNWTFWGQVINYSDNTFSLGGQLATDGTNLYYANNLQGVYYAPLSSQWFQPLPMTGFPLLDSAVSSNGFAVVHIATTALGTLVISGVPVSFNAASNSLNFAAVTTNTAPVFYWWDDFNQIWQPATIYGKSYPYTAKVGNFTTAQDGSLWTCSGYAPYAYRSTDGGRSYTAFDINASVPTNYFPIPFTGGEASFGNLFSIAAGPNNEIVVGTETGGYLFTTNNGLNWASLDPKFTDTNSVNPLGRVNDSFVTGVDHHGYFLLDCFGLPSNFPAWAQWDSVQLVGYRPQDGSYFNAANGLNPSFPPASVLTASSGVSFAYMNQNYLLQGGIYNSPDGANWVQFNQGSTLDLPFPNGITNELKQGNCFTTLSNLVFVGVGQSIYTFDSTLPPITNRPPVAHPQNLNLFQHTSTNFVLTGFDADGDSLNFTVTAQPLNGTLTGTPPNLTYIAPRHFAGLDSMQFVVDDGMATSPPVNVNFAVDATATQPPSVSFTATGNQGWLVEPTNIVFSATATAANGISQISFFNGTNLIGTVQNPPYVFTWTNVPPGDYALSACAIDTQQAATWSQPDRVLVLAVAPLLQISQADATDMTVSWPLALDNFFVETATNATGPWTLSPEPQSFYSTNQTATIPAANSQGFFRLQGIW